MKRPLSLTLFYCLAAIMPLGAVVSNFAVVRHALSGGWVNMPRLDVFVAIAACILITAGTFGVLWAVVTKKPAVRWVGAAIIAGFAGLRLYTLLFHGIQVNGALSEYRAEYSNPEFGFAVERLFSFALVALMFSWSYSLAFSEKVHTYLMNAQNERRSRALGHAIQPQSAGASHE